MRVDKGWECAEVASEERLSLRARRGLQLQALVGTFRHQAIGCARGL